MLKILVAFLLLLAATSAAAQELSGAKQRARALFKEGEGLYQTGQYQQAIDRYNEAYALVPLPLLLFDLGQAYRMKGVRDKAREYYRRYLDVEPNGRGAAEAREHLDELDTQPEQAAPSPAPAATVAPVVEPGRISLEQRVSAPPSKPRPMYKRWWLWTAVGAVAVAVAVGVGVGVGGTSRSQSEPLFPTVHPQ